jgi:hypothetical protein
MVGRKLLKDDVHPFWGYTGHAHVQIGNVGGEALPTSIVEKILGTHDGIERHVLSPCRRKLAVAGRR